MPLLEMMSWIENAEKFKKEEIFGEIKLTDEQPKPGLFAVNSGLYYQHK